VADRLLEDYENAVAEVARAEAAVERARSRCEALRKRIAAVMDRARKNPELPLLDGNIAPGTNIVIGIPAGPTEGMREVARYLEQRGRKANVDTVAADLGISYDAARIRLARATRYKIIRRVAHGIYAALSAEEES
jgi:hypothetical protein